MSPLITAEQLIADVAHWPVPVILDVRWVLGDSAGRQHYRDGHIPGAVFVDLPHDLSAPPSPAEGRHPLPEPEVFQAAMRRLGIDDGDRVVVYDDNGNTASSRAWWMLRWAGVSDVRILDGGLKAWRKAGGPLVVGPGNLTEPGNFTFHRDHMGTVTMDEAGQWVSRGVLLDVREAPRYAGRTEPVDQRAGHIPGAVNLPTKALVDAEGYFRPAEELRALFAERGITDGADAVVYCGSGVHACHALAAMEIAGLEGARLYPGAWSQWSRDRSRSIVIGPDPGDPVG